VVLTAPRDEFPTDDRFAIWYFARDGQWLMGDEPERSLVSMPERLHQGINGNRYRSKRIGAHAASEDVHLVSCCGLRP
jgi:hypothetical protein